MARLRASARRIEVVVLGVTGSPVLGEETVVSVGLGFRGLGFRGSVGFDEHPPRLCRVGCFEPSCSHLFGYRCPGGSKEAMAGLLAQGVASI